MRRPWQPYISKKMRLFATNKTTLEVTAPRSYGRREAKAKGNLLDPVRGCPGAVTNGGRGCPWGCYAVEATRRQHVMFNVPVDQVLDADLLRKDLRKCHDTWVRIGVNGEPSCNWELTTRVAEVCRSEGKDVVIITRLWGGAPDPGLLSRLGTLGVMVHVTLCALDREPMRRRALAFLQAVNDAGGRGVLRLVTFAFSPLHPAREVQDALWAWGGEVLEQPGRLQPANPTYDEVYKPVYHPCMNHVTGEPNPRWRTAGTVYSGTACADECPTCHHQCLTMTAAREASPYHLPQTSATPQALD